MFLKQICIRLSFYFVITRLNRKTVSKSFYIGEIELELRRINRVSTATFTGTGCNSIVNDTLSLIEAQRQRSLYPHTESDCSEECWNKGNKANADYRVTLLRVQ